MAAVLGMEIGDFGVNIPKVNITGFLSSSFIYILIIIIVGMIIIVAVALLLFMKTYNRKIEVYENISGAGYQRTLTTRARRVKLSLTGEEILKTLSGGTYLTAYGRKIGKNTYMFVKGTDGYLYNSVHGDFDTKLAMLDIEPIDRDVRMFHISMARMNQANYQKQKFMEKYGNVMLGFIFLIVMIGGMWVLIGQITKATTSLANTAETNADVAKIIQQEIVAYNNIRTGTTGTGTIPAGGG